MRKVLQAGSQPYQLQNTVLLYTRVHSGKQLSSSRFTVFIYLILFHFYFLFSFYLLHTYILLCAMFCMSLEKRHIHNYV